MTDVRFLMGNKYREARLEAAKYNSSLSTQDGAAEELEVETATLGRWERGATIPSNDMVRQMAELYRAPALLQDYCAYVCPIGCRKVQPAERSTLEQATIGLLLNSKDLEGTINNLLRIAADGQIDEAESPQFTESVSFLRKLKAKIEALEMICEGQNAGK